MVLFVAAPLWVTGCIGTPSVSGSGSASRRQFPLDTLDRSTVELGGQTIKVWLATDSDKRAEGLMYVTADEIADDEGMLFVFPDEELRSFWMKNTVISLDIAFARADGTIVATHTMPPLTLRSFSSIEPAMFALEMEAGALGRLGVQAGDRITIPESVFKAGG